MDLVQNHIEALIFCSQNPVGIRELKTCLSALLNTEVQEHDIETAVHDLEKKYLTEEFAFQIYKIAGGYQFMTKPAYQNTVGMMLKQLAHKKLSISALETLAIIAYKHPISRTDIEHIRGVNCEYAIRKLLEKGLITILGKAETIGKPLLYGINTKFMEYFGINDKSELPTPKDFVHTADIVNEEIDP